MPFSTERTEAAAQALLDAVGELEDPQVGLRLLRACAGHCRLVHSMRCAPPHPQAEAFQEFDRLVQACFVSLTGLHLDAGQWEQAGLSCSHAGLGLRSTALDAPAAYLASVGGCAELCSQVDAEFSPEAVPGRVDVQRALADLNHYAAAPLTASTALMLKQKALTSGLDEFRSSVAWPTAALPLRRCCGLRLNLGPGPSSPPHPMGASGWSPLRL